MKKTQVITRQKMLVEKGSGNVYADLGFPDSAEHAGQGAVGHENCGDHPPAALDTSAGGKTPSANPAQDFSIALRGVPGHLRAQAASMPDAIGPRRSNRGETYAPTARPRSTDRALRLTSKRALKTHRPAIFLMFAPLYIRFLFAYTEAQ